MAHKNRNSRNSWNDRDNDYRNEERERNRNSESRQNTSMHHNWNPGYRSPEQNYGLGDTSQGSENYGHIDNGRGARYYGTGNYGGYFGGGSDNDYENRHHKDRRGYEGRNETFADKNLNRGRGNNSNEEGRFHQSGNYERGPRYGNSAFHGRGYVRDNYEPYEGRRSGSGQNPEYGNYGNQGYDSGRNAGWSNDRDWWDKTTDEVSSWFGDEDANRRREMDQRYGEHHGKGPKGYRRSDEKIKDDVEERLYQDSFIDASDIEVSVSDGEVTLSGTVDLKQTKRRAEDCADAVSGVTDISNHLKVNRSVASNSEFGNLNSGNFKSSLDKQKTGQSTDLTERGNK